MQKLLIATHNKGKLKEIKTTLQQLLPHVLLVSLDEISFSDEPVETGATFEENAVLKARFYADRTSLPTIADDGGLSIPVLGNAPGVLSRRWIGRKASDEELIAFTLKKLHSFSGSKRTAYLTTCVSYYHPKHDIVISQTEKIQGKIAEKPAPSWTRGYPYRALFIVDTYRTYYDNLTPHQHDSINHRIRALKKIAPKIKSSLLIQ